jgi:hypothetical protein
MNYKLRLVQSNSEFKELEKTWDDLLSRSPADNFFLTWEWLWTWWEVYAEGGDELALFLLENENEVRGIAPLYVRKKKLFGVIPVRRLLFLGTQDSEEGDAGSQYMNLIYLSGDEKVFIDRLFSAILNNRLCDDLWFAKIDVASPVFKLLQDESRKRNLIKLFDDDLFDSPYVKIPETWDAYLTSIPAKMRVNINRERRRLQKLEDVAFSGSRTFDEAQRNFKELVKLHHERWKSRGQAGVFNNAKFLEFHTKMLPLLVDRGWLELPVLSVKKQSRAALYTFFYKNKIYGYQSGVEVSPGMPSFGTLLMSFCIENAIGKGLSEYDFMPKGPDHDYKDRFTNSIRKVAFMYMASGGTVKAYVTARECARFMYRRIKKLRAIIRPARINGRP